MNGNVEDLIRKANLLGGAISRPEKNYLIFKYCY